MLTNLEVFASGVTTPPIPIVDQDVSLDAIQIKRIDGLGPVKANINSTQYGTIDGESFDGGSTPKRNIVLTVTLNPDWASLSIEALRHILYSYFMPENTIRLRFSSTHMPTVEILGYVESCEPNLFEKDPEYQISILCLNPYFVAVDQSIITGTTSEIANPVDIPIEYQGDITTGFVLSLKMPPSGQFSGGETGWFSEFRLINKLPTTSLMIFQYMSVNTTQYMEISTVDGDKHAHVMPIPDAAPGDQLAYMSPGSTWPQLRRGHNVLQILAGALTPPDALYWTLTYYARYGGL